jgi:hypothetical protein
MHARQLAAAPFCALCWQRGLITPACVADHVERHHGNPHKFWFGRLQSLCESCHNGFKSPLERRGYDDTIGIDGYPIDRRHPWYKREPMQPGRLK